MSRSLPAQFGIDQLAHFFERNVDVVPRRGLGCRREQRLRQLVGFFHSRRKLDAADRARRLVLLPSRAGKVAARHALDRKHLGAHHHHGAAAEFGGMLANRRRVAVHVGGDQMVGDDVLEKVEPEQRNLRQHPALVRNAGRRERSRRLRCGRWRRTAGVRCRGCTRRGPCRWCATPIRDSPFAEGRNLKSRGSSLNSPGKNFGYSSCRGKFVNDFRHTGANMTNAAAPKIVDSSSVSEKACPAQGCEAC